MAPFWQLGRAQLAGSAHMSAFLHYLIYHRLMHCVMQLVAVACYPAWTSSSEGGTIQ